MAHPRNWQGKLITWMSEEGCTLYECRCKVRSTLPVSAHILPFTLTLPLPVLLIARVSCSMCYAMSWDPPAPPLAMPEERPLEKQTDLEIQYECLLYRALFRHNDKKTKEPRLHNTHTNASFHPPSPLSPHAASGPEGKMHYIFKSP